MNDELHKKVSIIIPNYNSQEYITECLDSVLNQDYPNLEIIVIDDGSTDDSLEIIKPYLNKIKLITQDNQGACVARNAGLEIATGEYIKFLDSDDYLAPGIISFQAKKLNQLDQYSVVFGDLIEKHADKSILREYSLINPHPTIESLILNGLITSLPLHRRALLLKINGFDARFKNWQEWNLHLRLASIGVKFIYQPGVVYYWRFHDSSDRISNNYKIDPDYEIKKRLFTLEDIKKLTHNKVHSSINDAMAYSLWLVARDYYFSNNNIEGFQCYRASQKISKNIKKHLPVKYNVISFFIGNQRTETMIYLRKKFTKYRKNLFSSKNIN